MTKARAARLPVARTAPAPRDRAGEAGRTLAAHRDDGDTELFGISELSAELGLSPRAIRFYEDKGLLSPRRVGGARVYTRRDRARLLLIQRGKAIGVSLSEMRHYLDLYGQRGEGRTRQLRYVLDRTDSLIAELEERRAKIDATLDELRLINASVRQALPRR